MSARIGVLRPEPGNAATAARVRAAGLVPVCIPLFRVAPVAWTAPDPDAFDALVLTSANAVRHAGPQLAALAGLSVRAVGPATARAAREAGLQVAEVGSGGVDSLSHDGRLLHLTGRDHVAIPGARTIIVYDSVAIGADVAPLADTVTLLHSVRAARRLGELVEDRTAIRLAAISGAVAEAAGTGWRAVVVAPAPDDAALIDTALRIA